MMKLLVFAHRGEAQAFLSAFNFKSLDYFFDGLFESEDFYLLITGEGTQAASEKTISVLTQFGNTIQEVFNIGVAGSLNKNLKKNDLTWIRTSYAHHAEKLEFKSFTSNDHLAKADCITAFARVLDLTERSKLSNFANLVDRELWAIASACHLYKRPFYALKIISDDMALNKPDICKFVKEEAPLFSQKLLLEFTKNQTIAQKNNVLIPNKVFLLDDSSFYFTTSQKRKLSSLLHGLELLGIDQNSLSLKEIKSNDLLPKERTRLLLQYLNDKLNPMAKKIRENIEKSIEPLTDASITAHFDSDFEQDWLQLSFKIQSSRDLEKIKNALRIFSYEDFKKNLNGDFE